MHRVARERKGRTDSTRVSSARTHVTIRDTQQLSAEPQHFTFPTCERTQACRRPTTTCIDWMKTLAPVPSLKNRCPPKHTFLAQSFAQIKAPWSQGTPPDRSIHPESQNESLQPKSTRNHDSHVQNRALRKLVSSACWRILYSFTQKICGVKTGERQ